MFQRAKKLIAFCLVILLSVNSALTILPAPAMAEANPPIKIDYSDKCNLNNNCVNDTTIARSDLLDSNTIPLHQVATTNQLAEESGDEISEAIEVIGAIIVFITGFIIGKVSSLSDTTINTEPKTDIQCYPFASCKAQ